MPSDYSTPSIEAGEAIRRLHRLRRWVEIRGFYRAIFRHSSVYVTDRLTALTASVWDHPKRYR